MGSEEENANIDIRLLAESDSIKELTELLHRAYRPLLEQGFRYVATHQTEEITLRRIAQGECYVAASTDRLVGTITLRRKEFSGPYAYYGRDAVTSFHQFGVDPSLQRQGIGGMLLARVEQRAKQLGYRELALDTAEGATHLIEMYRQRGYEVVGRINWDVTNYESIVMAKLLSDSRHSERSEAS